MMKLQNQISKKVISVQRNMKGKLYAIWKKKMAIETHFLGNNFRSDTFSFEVCFITNYNL